MVGMKRTSVAVAFLVSCSSAPRPDGVPSKVALEVPSADAPRAPEAPDPPDSPIPQAERLHLDAVACSAETRHLFKRNETQGALEVVEEEAPKLCDAGLSRCFLSFGAGGVDLTVSTGLGAAPQWFVEVRYLGLVFHGFVDLKHYFLFPREELRLGGFFRARHVTIAAGSPGRLTVRGHLPDGVSTKLSLEADVACDDVVWSEDSWEPPDAIDRRLGAKGESKVGHIPRQTHLSLVPRGPRVATIEDGLGPSWLPIKRRRELGSSRYRAARGTSSVGPKGSRSRRPNQGKLASG
jgi:hypothetical protein